MDKNKGKNKKDWTTPLVVMGIIAFLGIAFYFINQENSNSSSQNPNSNTNSQPSNQNNPSSGCSNECSFNGNRCFGNEIYSCYDKNNDGCSDKVFTSSCGYNEDCIGGSCIKREYCGDNICQSNEDCSSCSSDCGKCKVHDVRIIKSACTEPKRLILAFLDCGMACAIEVKNFGDYVESEYKVQVTVLNPDGNSYCARVIMPVDGALGIGGTQIYEAPFEKVSCSCLKEGSIVYQLI